MRQTRIIGLVLAFITLLVFLPAGWFDFVDYDDGDYVVNNSHVNHGLSWANLRWAFTAFYAANWHPLTWISHMVDCELFGLGPGAQHVINVLFHAANVVLLFLWIEQMTGRAGAAAVIAALFGWHPAHVESVAWISERKDVLSTFFALLALRAYTRYALNNHRVSFWRALIFFALGLMAKPMLVTLPFLLILLDFWPFNRVLGFAVINGKEPIGGRVTAGQLFMEKWPFFLLTIFSCVVTFAAQKLGGAVQSLEVVPFGMRLDNAVVSVAIYLSKLLMPVNLAVVYPLTNGISWWETGMALLVLGGVTVGAWHWRKERPYLLVGWLWFLGTLIPVSGLVQVGEQAMADRYTYIPSIGFFMAMVFLAEDWVGEIRLEPKWKMGMTVLVCLICIGVTEHQLQFWHNSETLFRRAIMVIKNNYTAHLNLGTTLAQQKRYDEALVEYREASRLVPGSYQIYNDIGDILDQKGDYGTSAEEYRQALRIKPGIGYLHDNLAKSLIDMGAYDEARNEILAAERLDPMAARPHALMAWLLESQGQDGEAVLELQTAVRLEPENYGILLDAAHFLAADENPAGRDGATAVKLALKAGALSGNQPGAIDVLGMALAETGDFTNAVACAESLLEAAATGNIEHTNEIRERLELYRKHQAWRESFVASPSQRGK